MSDRTILVTGATDGIGKATAYALAEKGAHLLVHGRNQQKCEALALNLNKKYPASRVGYFVSDFSSLQSVKVMSEQIISEVDALHVLINNAGNFYRRRTLSEDSFELTFAVNHLAPFLLTLNLLDLLKASAPARIVNVSSTAHKSARADDLSDLMGERGYDPFSAYSLSKLANVFFTQSLADRLDPAKVTANSLHPGVVDTKLLRNSYNMRGISIEEGARTSVYLAVSPEITGTSGKYYQNETEGRASSVARDRDLQEELWRQSMDMVRPYLIN